jgi:ferric-dicitrate binding protein FerR (iron transport regulator)
MGSKHEIDFKYLLDRMVSGELTPTEKEVLHTYIRNSYQDADLNLFMRNHWLSLEDKELVGDETAMHYLKNRIISRISETEIAAKPLIQRSLPVWKNYLMRAAAVLFIPLLLGSLFIFYRMDKRIAQMASHTVIGKVVAHPGSRVHFTLPDQTEVWLNSGSTLEYPLALNEQENRKVKLSGQGYFKVAHDPSHPFFVETDGIRIKALGTSFDVSGYAEDRQISSTLEEGSIALLDLSGKEVTRIYPGQKAVLDKSTNSMEVKEVETMLTTSWKDGKLIFRNTSLLDVTIQLERWFTVRYTLIPGY